MWADSWRLSNCSKRTAVFAGRVVVAAVVAAADTDCSLFI